MKNWMILLVFLSSTSFADTVFTGRAAYQKYWGDGGKPQFRTLERKGIMHEAILDALGKCNFAGKRNCVYVSSRIVRCGYATGPGASYVGCEGEATLIAVD